MQQSFKPVQFRATQKLAKTEQEELRMVRGKKLNKHKRSNRQAKRNWS